MRAPVYVWGDGTYWHLWPRDDQPKVTFTSPSVEDIHGYPGFDCGIAISEKVFDEIVVLRMAQLVREQGTLKKIAKRLRKRGHGNFGTWDFFELLGDDPAAAFKAKIEESRKVRASVPSPGDPE